MSITGVAIHHVLHVLRAYQARQQPTNGRPIHRLNQWYIDLSSDIETYNNGGYPREESIIRSSIFIFSVAALTMLNLETILTY